MTNAQLGHRRDHSKSTTASLKYSRVQRKSEQNNICGHNFLKKKSLVIYFYFPCNGSVEILAGSHNNFH